MRVVVESSSELRKFSCDEDPLDIFDSYTVVNGCRVRTNRRWYGQGPKKFGEWLNSRIIYRGEDLDYGEDPRIFINEGRVCICSVLYSERHGYRNHLIQIAESGCWSRYYLMPPKAVSAGKNWSPFSLPDGRIGFVHSFSPLRILREIKREAGIILLESYDGKGIEEDLDDELGFPAHRGGTNGVLVGDFVYGVGHTTRTARDKVGQPIPGLHGHFPNNEQVIHRPFVWKLNVHDWSLSWNPFQYAWDKKYWMIDPTSLVYDASNGKFDLYTTEVETTYVDPDSAGRTMHYTLSIS